ncbi:peptidylprolyl isomerase [Microbacterium fluvii]
MGMPQHSAVATLHTNHGDIVVNLFGDHAPRTVQNFIGLSDGTGAWTDPATGKPGEGPLYTDVVFHRIIPGFMIQGGDPLGQGIGGPGYNFDDEIHPELNFGAPYLLAMANAGLRRNAITGKAEGTNGSQFFITTDPTPWLNGKHTIFGEVADDASRAVVDAISAVPTGAADRPIEPVVIQSIDIAAV